MAVRSPLARHPAIRLARPTPAPAPDRLAMLRRFAAALAGAAAAGGLAEAVLQRIAFPLAAHIPASASAPGAVQAIGEAGVRAAAAAALLVCVALVAQLAALRRERVITSAAGVAALATLLAAARTEPATLLVAQVALAAAALLITVRAVRTLRPAAVALGAAATAVVASRLPLIADAAGADSWLPAAAPATLAEAAWLVVPVSLALEAVRLGAAPRTAGAAAAVVLVSALAALALAPAHLAMVSMWAFGVTLSLPLALYVVAAAGVAFVVAASRREPALRPAVAGLVLLAVAGLRPPLVHHDLTALLGVLLLIPVDGLLAVGRPSCPASGRRTRRPSFARRTTLCDQEGTS